jgi:uncharacterized protein (DUF1697 family)
MTRYAAFLRGVNLGKRTVKSADLKAAIETMGFTDAKTLIASGNVLFEAAESDPRRLREQLESGLEEAFEFRIGVVLRTLDDIRAMVAAAPFADADPDADCTFHVLIFAEPASETIAIEPVAGDYEAARVDADAIYFIAYRKPDGTYLGRSALADRLKPIEKNHVTTMRNWNTIEKAAAQ